MDGMLIAFYSMTGNVRRFVNGTDIGDQFELYEIKAANKNEKIREPYILVTSTYGFGGIPAPVERFLDVNSEGMQAVASSGNRNWGSNFAKAGEHIRQKYKVPLLMKFELHGTKSERELFKEKAGSINESIGREEVQSY